VIQNGLRRLLAWGHKTLDRRVAGSTLMQLFYLGLILCVIIIAGGLSACWAGKGKGACVAFWEAFVYATDSGYMGQNIEPSPKAFGIVITLLGWVFMSGLFLTFLVNGYQQYVEAIQAGKHRYYFGGGHGIILGWNRMGVSVVDQLVKHGCSEIAILALREAPAIRRHLKAELHNYDTLERRVFVLNGSFGVRLELERLNPGAAKEIVILGDPDAREDQAVLGGTDISSCDTRNVEAAMLIAEIMAGKNARKEPLRCHIHLSNLRSYRVFQRMDLPQKGDSHLELRPFNFFENWAWQLWSPLVPRDERATYHPLTYDKAITRDNGRFVHVFIIGFGFMGQSIALHAARIAHFANGQKTRITIVDKQLDWWRDVFLSHCAMENIPDVSVEFVAEAAESPEVRGRLTEAARDERCVLTVAVTLSNPDAAMAAALSLPREILMRDIPVLVRQETFSGLSRLTELIGNTKCDDAELWDEIRFFGQLDHCVRFNEERELIARRIHEYYLLQAKRNAEAKGKKFVPKPSQVPWEQLPMKYRLSNVYQADMIAVKLRAMGYELVPACVERPLHVFTEEEIERLAEMEHDRWVAERIIAGWTYSTERDDRQLRHPDLVSYSRLDEPTKDYDRDAARNLPELLRTGYGYDLAPMDPESRV